MSAPSPGQRSAVWWLAHLLTVGLVAGSMIGGGVFSIAAAELAASAATGQIAGTVSNAGTGNLLEGARVELPQLGLSALADHTGRFVLTGVPAGTHEIVASYTGLDSARSSVVVNAGGRSTHDFDLTAGVYRLAAFTVSGEREGTAAAITAQRNAEHVKNVVAMDTYGNLPNLNATELALRLPGVAGIPGDEVVEGVTTTRTAILAARSTWATARSRASFRGRATSASRGAIAPSARACSTISSATTRSPTLSRRSPGTASCCGGKS